MTASVDLGELTDIALAYQAGARELLGLTTDVHSRLASLPVAALSAYGIHAGPVAADGASTLHHLVGDERALEACALRIESQIAAVAAAGGGTIPDGSAESLWWYTLSGKTPPGPTGPAAIDAHLVAAAEQWVGEPYVWGGGHGSIVAAHAEGVDCSGLVEQVYGENGINLGGGTAQSLYDMSRPVTDIANAQPGDLVFYHYGATSAIDHVAIYIGNGQMIEAPQTGETVHVTALRTGAGFAGIHDMVDVVDAPK